VFGNLRSSALLQRSKNSDGDSSRTDLTSQRLRFHDLKRGPIEAAPQRTSFRAGRGSHRWRRYRLPADSIPLQYARVERLEAQSPGHAWIHVDTPGARWFETTENSSMVRGFGARHREKPHTSIAFGRRPDSLWSAIAEDGRRVGVVVFGLAICERRIAIAMVSIDEDPAVQVAFRSMMRGVRLERWGTLEKIDHPAGTLPWDEELPLSLQFPWCRCTVKIRRVDVAVSVHSVRRLGSLPG